ncbi:GyrI-like domain-containing protein [Corallococcus sp. EGB]|uniref:GyrI-like domain-containing protein n=1 Tax=Corallococcus sp. EGB TaxID=1521117 RepID=UPI001CBE971C|nr:GyrI-like domain-containing protein [Corallococcus sp. EGB]
MKASTQSFYAAAVRRAVDRIVHQLDEALRISEAFQQPGELAGAVGLLRQREVTMLAVYHDVPETTPQDPLRSEAAVVVPDDAILPEGLNERRLPAGAGSTRGAAHGAVRAAGVNAGALGAVLRRSVGAYAGSEPWPVASVFMKDFTFCT